MFILRRELAGLIKLTVRGLGNFPKSAEESAVINRQIFITFVSLNCWFEQLFKIRRNDPETQLKPLITDDLKLSAINHLYHPDGHAESSTLRTVEVVGIARRKLP